MSRNRKPRKAYRPRERHGDNLDYVIKGVAKPSQAQREQLLGMVRAPIKALREGVATELEWSIAAGAVELAKAVEGMGVVRGLAEHLASAEAALQGIYNRAMARGEWHPTALYYQELDALQLFLELYAFQIGQLSRDEIDKAARLANRQAVKAGHMASHRGQGARAAGTDAGGGVMGLYSFRTTASFTVTVDLTGWWDELMRPRDVTYSFVFKPAPPIRATWRWFHAFVRRVTAAMPRPQPTSARRCHRAQEPLPAIQRARVKRRRFLQALYGVPA